MSLVRTECSGIRWVGIPKTQTSMSQKQIIDLSMSRNLGRRRGNQLWAGPFEVHISLLYRPLSHRGSNAFTLIRPPAAETLPIPDMQKPLCSRHPQSQRGDTTKTATHAFRSGKRCQSWGLMTDGGGVRDISEILWTKPSEIVNK